MARHRNVRSMNFSDEYEGYDDVYGHSVEDDYSVSPSVADFMYDRSRPAEMGAFLAEENDIAEEDEEMLDDVPEPGLLSDVVQAKLMSCVEEIQNIIGDAAPLSVIQETVIKNNYDLKKSLDAILNQKDTKHVPEPAAARIVIPTIKTDPKPGPAFRGRDQAAIKPFNALQNLLGQRNSTVETSSTAATSLAAFSENYLKVKAPLGNLSKPGFLIPKLMTGLSTTSKPDPEKNQIVDLSHALKCVEINSKSSAKNEHSVSILSDRSFCNLEGFRMQFDANLIILSRESCSPFGRVLCRYKNMKRKNYLKNLKKICNSQDNGKLACFDFNTLSPDDKVLQHLHR